MDNVKAEAAATVVRLQRHVQPVSSALFHRKMEPPENRTSTETAGLVARVVPAEKLMEEVLATAGKIASFSLPAVMKVKETINTAFETTLSQGLLFERREFHATFALEDQKEGMRAFVEKRKPVFKNG